jgi:hypothetical protein
MATMRIRIKKVMTLIYGRVISRNIGKKMTARTKKRKMREYDMDDWIL